MDLGLGNTLLPGDPRLIDHIVGEVKSQGIFDQFRKDALADVDTKPAYQNLRTRVEGSVNSFLAKQVWKADLNKNQLRETLRKHISDGAYLDAGVERIVDQVVNPKIYSVFMPQVEDVVYKYLGLEKPKREKNGSCSIKDLLPIDLDPVSPESDKNSLKDISLDSADADILSSNNKRNAQEHLQENEENTVNHEIKNNEEININNDNSESIGNRPTDEDDNKIMSSTPPINSNLLNDSAKSDDKTEEEEEDSPVFEPIDIMNFNESNVSNDSHLSGISELTSHRSRSPDFGNEFSRDNFDFSNQYSQFSKVSSDSHLSIITDFGSSNPASTPASDTPKEDNNKDKLFKDNLKITNDDSDKSKEKDVRINECSKQKDVSDNKDGPDTKSLKSNSSSKELSRDSTDGGNKDKERNRGSLKSKSSKERSDSRDSRSHRDKSHKRKSNSSDNKSDHFEKFKITDKDSNRESLEKSKEKEKEILSKNKEEKSKDLAGSKEPKDLKDIYKEKIRELREKKELTEKEKLNKDNKDYKFTKDLKDKKSSVKDKNDDRSSTIKSHSSVRHENKSKSSSRDDSKSCTSNSKDKSKKDERCSSALKDSKNKTQVESIDKKKASKSDKKDEKSDRKNESKSIKKKDFKKEFKSDSHNKSSEKSESKRNSDSKEKKRRDEKKSKTTKDDHGSLRKNTSDRRSSDRDGSSGSNSKSSKSSSSPSSSSIQKPTDSNLNKESNNTSNSSSETSDGVDESHVEENHCPDNVNDNTIINTFNYEEMHTDSGGNLKRIDLGQNEISLPLKKRPLQAETDHTASTELMTKKSKTAKNVAEIKETMSVEKKLEKQKSKNSDDGKVIGLNENISLSSDSNVDLTYSNVPDDERVQIIEVKDDEEDEPYPDDIEGYLKSKQPSRVILEEESLFNPEFISKQFNSKSKLSETELSIRQSLIEMMSDNKLEKETPKSNPESSFDSDSNTNNRLEKEYSSCKTLLDENTEEYNKNDIAEVKNSSNYLRQSQTEKFFISTVNKLSDDEEEDCLYFLQDNDRLNRFNKFLKSLEQEENSIDEEIKIIMNDESKSSEFNTMAPPLLKRKYSTSPLSDILLNNSDNNNETGDANKIIATMSDEEGAMKKKRVGRPKKQRPSLSSSSPLSVTNGEHFVMPLSPDSDVSATSERTSLNHLKDDRSRQRNNQRYTSDDLYKPRPLFVSSSRRSRRSDQA